MSILASKRPYSYYLLPTKYSGRLVFVQVEDRGAGKGAKGDRDRVEGVEARGRSARAGDHGTVGG